MKNEQKNTEKYDNRLISDARFTEYYFISDYCSWGFKQLKFARMN